MEVIIKRFTKYYKKTNEKTDLYGGYDYDYLNLLYEDNSQKNNLTLLRKKNIAITKD